ncbi:transmembrane protein 223 [Anoplophora glabripennis]|uniref:transmembrane protein 223 n=1 Tax=Anoplophora glabripennis TaxID=217634 RepID=UPI000873822D|nr:transmembrane protein 223 [Anoplophora glabripennis]
MLFLIKCIEKCSIYNVLYKSNSLKTNFIKRYYNPKSFDINTNVVKDVILYKHPNDRFFKIVNLFAICQFGFWTYLALFAFTNLKDVPVDDKEEKWWRKVNLGDTKYRTTFTIISFLIGWGILCVTWMYSLRSVKYLILKKGGKEVTIITHTPTGGNKMLTLKLDNLSCKDSRTSAGSQLPIQVKGHYLHYILDMRGAFTNPTLFDQTAGLRRKWAL